MIMRRRPLLRAAAASGGAYYAGKRAAERAAMIAQQEEQAERIASVEEQAQSVPYQRRPDPAQQPPAGLSVLEQLNQLAALHQQGALSDSEFAAAKAKVLG
jgi:hypothetical protein